MNMVEIECTRCGEMAVTPMASLFAEAADLVDDRMGGTAYWICATCDDLISTPVSWADLLTLVSSGAALIEEGHDEGFRSAHPEMPTGGAPLTFDDLLDLHAALAEPTWRADLAEEG